MIAPKSLLCCAPRELIADREVSGKRLAEALHLLISRRSLAGSQLYDCDRAQFISHRRSYQMLHGTICLILCVESCVNLLCVQEICTFIMFFLKYNHCECDAKLNKVISVVFAGRETATPSGAGRCRGTGGGGSRAGGTRPAASLRRS
jgi:hypothetical protein